MLAVTDLNFDYHGKVILKNVTLHVNEGEIVALIGISGSGKTTLFKLISGLISPQQGTISINGCSTLRRKHLATFMRQEDLLLPWRTVMGNLMLFRELGKAKKRAFPLWSNPLSDLEIKEEAKRMLRRVGLGGHEEAYPSALSGGMKQRLALARALLQKRPLMLLDEPFASLDIILREQLYVLLREIRDQYKKTIFMVTHDFRDAMALADRILVLGDCHILSSYLVKGHSLTELSNQIRADLLSSATIL